MGLFFKRNTNTNKRSVTLKLIFSIIMGVLLVVGILDDFNFFYLGLLFIVAGIGELVDGVEGYIRRENKYYYINFSFGLLLFILGFIYLT